MRKMFSTLFVFAFMSLSANAENFQGEDCVDFAQEGIQLEMDSYGPMTFTEYNHAFLAWYSLCRDAQQ